MNPKPLNTLYKKIPGVPCIAGCNACCVSPNVTLAEFIYLMEKLCGKYADNEVRHHITKPIKPHPRFEGNYYCRFQNDAGFCINHHGRGAACRLHGLPVIQKLGVSNMENCSIMQQSLLPQVGVNVARQWLLELLELNKTLYPNYGGSFLRLIGLNIECWLDITFTEAIHTEELNHFQNLIGRHCSFLPKIPDYPVKTEIFEKMDTIQLLEMCVNIGDKPSALAALKKLKTGFPTTGTYFCEQADWMESRLLNPGNTTDV